MGLFDGLPNLSVIHLAVRQRRHSTKASKERASKGARFRIRLLSEIRYTAEGYSDTIRLARAGVFQKQGRYLVG